MKSFKILLVLCTIHLFIACDKDNDDLTRIEAEVQQLNLIAAEGEWRISEFNVNGTDNTANFSDYLFIFQENNELLATSTAEDIFGTWRVSNDSGSEFDSFYDVDFNIFFSSTGKLAELTRNYDVISANDEQIKLEIENSEAGNMVFLTFSKN